MTEPYNARIQTILSCDYCFAVFEKDYWSWCVFSNQENDTKTYLCSICAWEILNNQRNND